MKKSYSTFDLLQKQLSGVMESKGLFGSFLSGRKYFNITLPYLDYIRGKIFIDDLRDNYGDEIPFNFDIAVLLHLLYTDFLKQVKSGNATNEHVASYLIAGKRRYFQQKIQERKIMKPLTPHILEFETIEEEIEEDRSSDERTAYITLRMRESEILRGEVLLHDLFHARPDEITVEELISIVFLDFMQRIKTEGNSLKLQKAILTHL